MIPLLVPSLLSTQLTLRDGPLTPSSITMRWLEPPDRFWAWTPHKKTEQPEITAEMTLTFHMLSEYSRVFVGSRDRLSSRSSEGEEAYRPNTSSPPGPFGPRRHPWVSVAPHVSPSVLTLPPLSAYEGLPRDPPVRSKTPDSLDLRRPWSPRGYCQTPCFNYG